MGKTADKKPADKGKTPAKGKPAPKADPKKKTTKGK